MVKFAYHQGLMPVVWRIYQRSLKSISDEGLTSNSGQGTVEESTDLSSEGLTARIF